jgi:hypothetical protein
MLLDCCASVIAIDHDNDRRITMLNTFRLLVLATTVVASSSAAFAQDQGRWLADSGRYVNGQVPSYSDPTHKPALIEGRNSAAIGNTSTDRDALVGTVGN